MLERFKGKKVMVVVALAGKTVKYTNPLTVEGILTEYDDNFIVVGDTVISRYYITTINFA